MPIHSRLLPALVVVSTFFTSASALANDPKQPDAASQLTAARIASSLADPALKPWHMLVSFDLLNPDGSVKEHGTLEEWWGAPDHWRRRIVSPSYNQDLYRVGDQSFAAAPARLPHYVSVLAQQIVSPIPSFPADLALTMEKQTKTFGPAQFDCILVQPAKRLGPLAFGLTPTYCLEQQHPTLRFLSESGSQEIIRNRLGLFQDKSVALDLKIEEAGRPALHATIDQLQSRTLADADLAPPANLPPVTMLPRVSSGVIAGRKIGGPQPQYPADAKRRHVTGAVLLSAVIDKDGHVLSTEVISSPDPSLSSAAMNAVNQWVYQPYLLNGQPTEVETTITVSFSIGS